MGIKDDPNFNMCNTEIDSNSHMLIYCEKSKKLRSDVKDYVFKITF